MAIATLTIDLVAKLANLERDMGRAAQVAERNAQRMEKAFSVVGKTIAGLGVGVALERLVTNTANAADELSKLSQRTGVTVEQLSALNYAAGLNDATLKDLEQGLKGLSNKMLDAAKGGKESAAVFDALGINIKDAAGNLRGVDAVFGDLADAFKALPDGAEKAALANRLMEESGIRLIPTLNAGRDGLKEMGDEAARFGAIIGTDLAAASVALNDNMTKLNVQLAAMGVQFGSQLIPTLAVATEGMVQFGAQSAIAGRIGDGLNQIFTVAAVSLTTIGEKIGIFGSALGAVGAQIGALLRGDFGQVATIAEAFKSDMEQSSLALSDFHFKLIQASEGGAKFGTATEKSGDAAKRAADLIARLTALTGDSSKASKAAAAAEKARAKELADAAKLQADILRNEIEGQEVASDALRTIQDLIDARERENEELGLSADALSLLKGERLEATAAQKEETAAALDAIEPGSRLADLYRQQATALRELAAVQREGDVKQATIEAAEAARDAWRDISDDVAESLTDAILQGGDAWESLVKSIEATVIRATILPIVQGGVQAVLQAAGLGPGGGGGGGGLFSQAGNAASLYSTGSSLVGYGQAAYTGYTAAAGGTDLSAAIAAYNSSGYYGTAASLQAGQAAGGVAGSGAGAAVPYLGAMAAFLVAAEWFAGLGNSLRRFGSAVETTLGDTGDIVSRLIDNTNDTVDIIDSRFARAFESDAQAEARLTAYNEDRAQREGGAGYEPTRGRGARLEDVDPLLAEINAAAIESTQAFISSLTGRDSPLFSLSSLFMSREGDDSTGRLFVRGSGGQDLLSFNQDFKAGQAGFEAFGQSFSRVTLAVLRSMDDLDTGLEAIIDAVDPATAAIESVQAALDLLGQFQSALEAAEAFGNVDDALEAVRIGTLDATSQFGLMRDELTRAATAGELSVEQILAGMGTVYQGFTQLLQNIDAASRSVADSTANNIRSIQLAVLDGQGKYGFLDAEIARQLDTLRTLTDPALITDYLGRVQGNLSAAFGLLQDGEQQRLADEFIDRFNEVGAIAQQQLDVARDQAIADQRAQRDEMVAAIREAFADPAAALAAAAQTFAGTTIGVDARVTVNVPAEAEVSTYVRGDN